METSSKYQIGQTIYKTCINIPNDETEIFYPEPIERGEYKILGISRFYIVLDNPDFDKIRIIREDPIDVIKVSTTGGYFVSLYSTATPSKETLGNMLGYLELEANTRKTKLDICFDKIWAEIELT